MFMSGIFILLIIELALHLALPQITMIPSLAVPHPCRHPILVLQKGAMLELDMVGYPVPADKLKKDNSSAEELSASTTHLTMTTPMSSMNRGSRMPTPPLDNMILINSKGKNNDSAIIFTWQRSYMLNCNAGSSVALPKDYRSRLCSPLLLRKCAEIYRANLQPSPAYLPARGFRPFYLTAKGKEWVPDVGLSGSKSVGPQFTYDGDLIMTVLDDAATKTSVDNTTEICGWLTSEMANADSD
ncbi:hypothetical protein BDP27DRAFT_1366134 [Rhodocollybia butyracea]|uniref:Uncharacterized protein n=1 Tax=Rhodocollybia butyracea TaxID=206335 RepID=A0A9P5PLZ5_9AGAR|nr:hypothetical protein BDP27DRAFT_1366134 [Rhodocollybia butyracea]